MAFHPSQPRLAVLGTSGGLFLSRDQGRYWQPTSLPSRADDIQDVRFDAHEPDRIYVVTSSSLFVGDVTAGTWQEQFRVRSAEASEVEEAPRSSA